MILEVYKFSTGIAACFYFLLLPFAGNSQFVEVPPVTNSVLQNAWKVYSDIKHHAGPRNFQDTVTLPFVDDFSYPGPYPDPAKWLDNQAFVNPNLAIDPVTLGVATLDGLRPDGTPWGGGYGPSDTLTSRWIDLSGLGPGSNVYLSFFYQAKGLGDRPEAHDSLIVEFKHLDGHWKRVWEIPGFAPEDPVNLVHPFQLVTLPVNQPELLYNGFQFRFRNKSNNSGQIDLWHIDYVRVTHGEIPTTTFQDIAIIDPLQSIMKPYTAMPYRHFMQNKEKYINTQQPLRLYNHTNQTQPAGMSVFDVKDSWGNTIYTTVILDNLGENNIPSQQFTVYDNVLTGATEADDLISALAGFELANPDTADFITHRMFISPSNQDPNNAASFRNDTIERQFHFDEYFAYDDGSAETNIAAQNIGTQIAVAFHTEVNDTLRAFQIHFPRIAGNVENELFNFNVWLDTLDGPPQYQDIFYRPLYVDSLFGFTTYVIQSPDLYIPAGRFYIGWQAATSTPIPVGFDRSNPDAAQHIKFSTGGSWNDFPLEGAVMFRPVLGNHIPVATSAGQVELPVQQLKVFPNPVQHFLHIELEEPTAEALWITMYDAHGRRVMHFPYTTDSVDVSALPQGVYYLQVAGTQRAIYQTTPFIKL